MTRRFFITALAFALWLASTAPSAAQGGFGFHGGATADPDQGFFGMHFISNPLSGDLRLHPAADVGFGNEVVLSSLHIDFANWFVLGPVWQLYFGGGPAINVYRSDEPSSPRPPSESTIDLEGGFDTIVGFAHEGGTTFELRIGTNGSPDLRFSVGYTFRR